MEDKRMPKVIFIPFMAIPEGGVRFPLDPFLLRTFNFYGICPNQVRNFYRVVTPLSHNHTFEQIFVGSQAI